MLKSTAFINEGTTASSILLTGNSETVAKNKQRKQNEYKKQLAESKIANIDIFTAPRKADEVDLVGTIRTLLLENELGPNIHHYDNSQLVKDAAPIGTIGQIFLLNRYWRLQLISVDTESSLDNRSRLIDDIDEGDWLRLFKEGVLPFIVKHSLPRQL